MPLSAGTRIGPYEIVAPLGAGGMGEVYRATDLNLKRTVAIKVLPIAFASNPERLARFQREAEVLARLNHPHIAQVHGLEKSDGTTALVMELVEGPTLDDVIHRPHSAVLSPQSGDSSPKPQAPSPRPHALRCEDALPIARQIVAAIETAHAQGIIHRDLKPANIKVRPDGTVKVLDFGLAKALDPAQDSGRTAQGNPATSPTITSPAMTEMGMILGTAAYMSPEQAKGRSVDERADIWAFGCTLFEMLTGRRAFAGDDVSDTLASILKSEPDWSALPDATPAPVRRLLRRCLSKDLAGRLPDISVARLEIDDAMSPDVDAPPALPPPSAPSAPPRSRWPFVALGVAVAALLAALPMVFSHLRETPPPASTVRFSVPPPNGLRFHPDTAFPTPSPDGQHLIYRVVAPNSPERLWLYSLSTQSARELPGTDHVGAGFWSPDSRAIAFVIDGKLKRLDLAGGSVQTLADVKGTAGAGGSWNRDGTIILGNATSGLMRVPATGGELAPLTTLDTAQKDIGHVLPQFLPDGRRFLFTVIPSNVVRVGSLDSSTQSEVLKAGTHAWYSPPGYLLYARQSTLVAQPFDVSSATVSGDPVPVADGVRLYSGLYGLFSMSANGVLVYESSDDDAGGGTPVWVDRNGRTTPAVKDGADNAFFPQLSPDGRRFAMIRDDDLWVQDLEGHPPIRLTFDGKDAPHFTPLWSRDGQRIVYETGGARLRMLPSDASSATPATVGPGGHFHPHGWSSDGRELVAVRIHGNPDIVALSTAGDAAPRDVVATPAREGFEGTALSPDGRWIAYSANPTGQMEIWVRPFPGPGAPVRISPGGGEEPVWARNGRELFYHDATRNQLMAVSLQPGAEFRFSAPAALFGTSEFMFSSQPPSYDVAADGRLLMIKPAGRAQPGTRPLTVVLNWAEEVRRASGGR